MSSSEEALRLPSGWSAVFDPTYGCNYFYHAASDKTQWERPCSDTTEPDATNGSPEKDPHQNVESVPSEGLLDNYSEQQTASSPANLDLSDPIIAAASTGDDNPPGPSPEMVDGSFVDEANRCSPSATDGVDDTSKAAMNISISPDKTKWVGGDSQDYLHLAEVYKLQRVYADPDKDMNCALCKKRLCTDVFFPCQHRCVCSECIVSQQVVEHHHLALLPNAHCNCPLCGVIIKKIIQFEGGAEVEKYWKWVCEVNPSLPDGFLRNFRHSAAVIQKVYVVDNNKDNKPSRSCVVS